MFEVYTSEVCMVLYVNLYLMPVMGGQKKKKKEEAKKVRKETSPVESGGRRKNK